jgi:hypothetical protein
MSAKRVKPPHLELEIILDTNALYTGSASHFLRKEVSDLIEQTSNLPDLTMRWIVPEIVRHERQFQMLQEASQMLPTIQRLERLLGHNLNITKEILDARVKEVVDRQVQQYAITVRPLSPTGVDWPRLILDAAYRRPPFQLGEKEKGFRDALILETFMQIVGSSPTSRSVARVALVSNDQLLREATQSRLGNETNIHLLESIDALKGLINTLGSAVDEEFIAAIKPRAADVFFKSGDESTLYYKASVGAELEKRLRNAAVGLPTGADKYTIERWTLGSPRFVKKQVQRIYWTTRFEAKLKALKTAPQSEWVAGGSLVTLGSLSGQNAFSFPTARAVNTASFQPSASPAMNVLSTTWQPSESLQFSNPSFINVAEDQLVSYGTASMDASWSLAVTTSGTLTKPRLESVEYVEVVWG